MRWRSVVVLSAVLAAGLTAGVGYRVLRLETIEGTLQGIIPAPDFRAGRAIYSYSLIPGGVRNSYELSQSIEHDPVIAAYYRDVRPAAMFPLRLASDMQGYVSYRIGSQIFWTRNLIRLRKGELVLTDGHTMIRGRCGNQILPAHFLPKAVPTTLDPAEPPEIVFETGYPPVMTLPHNQAVLAEKQPPVLPVVPTAPPTDAPSTFWPPLIPPVAWCCSGATQTGTPPPVPTPTTGGIPIVPPVIPPSGPDTRTTPTPPETPTMPPTPVPEPATLVLVGSGLVAVRMFSKRPRR